MRSLCGLLRSPMTHSRPHPHPRASHLHSVTRSHTSPTHGAPFTYSVHFLSHVTHSHAFTHLPTLCPTDPDADHVTGIAEGGAAGRQRRGKDIDDDQLRQQTIFCELQSHNWS